MSNEYVSMSMDRFFKILKCPSDKNVGFSTPREIDEVLDEVLEDYGFENRMRLLDQAIKENEYLSLSIRDITKY